MKPQTTCFFPIPQWCLLLLTACAAPAVTDSARIPPQPLSTNAYTAVETVQGNAQESDPTPTAPAALHRFAHAYFGELSGSLTTETPPMTPSVGAPVVLVIVDALNARHLGAYGYHRNTSPFIDAIARDGIRFTSWISTSSWTRPAVTSILTGLPKAIHGMELSDRKLDRRIVTLAQVFRTAGYRTAAFIGNPLISRKWNYHQGFDVFQDEKTFGPFPQAQVLVDAALEWLETVDESPFFLCIFVTDPHTPYDPPTEGVHFSAAYTDVVRDPPREVQTPFDTETLEAMIAAYDDEIAWADRQLGRLFDRLEQQGRLEEAIVAVTADHGEIFGEHGAFQHAWHMWEPVIRVPFILRAPALSAFRGTVVDAAAGHEDVMPTLLHLSGIETPPAVTGSSVLAPSDDLRQPVAAYDAAGVRRIAVRDGDWKMVRYEAVHRPSLRTLDSTRKSLRYPSLSLPAPRFELYDLATDPDEQHNRFQASDDTAREQRLLSLIRDNTPWKTASEPTKTPPAQIAPKLDPELLDALKAAGYIR